LLAVSKIRIAASLGHEASIEGWASPWRRVFPGYEGLAIDHVVRCRSIALFPLLVLTLPVDDVIAYGSL
jgi:hypothetical protein